MDLTEKHYEVYGRHNTHLKSGDFIKLDLSVSINAKETKGLLKELITGEHAVLLPLAIHASLEQEQEAFDILETKVDDLLKTMAELQLLSRAFTYKNKGRQVEELETTNNEWDIEEYTDSTHWFISNKVYAFEIVMTEYDSSSGPYWKVYYYSTLNTPIIDNHIIKYKDTKYKTKEEASKYVEGRRDYYSKYFKELYPLVPKEYFNYFSLYDLLLEHYKLEK